MALTIKHRVTLDLSLTSVQATVPFRRGDTAAHEVIFNLRNGTTNVELPVGSVANIAVLNGCKETGVLDACVVDHVNNQINYIPTVDALAVAGNIACELVVTGPYGETLGAPRFHFLVDDSMTNVTEEAIAEALKASGSWDVIQKTATNAIDAAQSKEDAETARVAAETAQGKAETARVAAETAQGKAESAQGAAVAAKTAAEAAQGKAEAAKTAAETAQGKAETAKTAAETAQGKAETAKTAAETAKTAAETAQAAAVTARYEANISANRASGSAQTASDYATSAGGSAKKAQEYAEKIGTGAASITASLNNKNYKLTLELLDASGDSMSDVTIDLPLESLITHIAYDDETKELIFTLHNGEKTRVPLDDTVSGLATNTELEAGLDGKVDKLPAEFKLKLYGTDSYGDQTSYSVVGTTGTDPLAIMTQAAVTAALKALSTSIKTNEDNIAENADRISELEKGGGGSGLNNLYDAEIPVGEITNGKMIASDGSVADDSGGCVTDFIVVNAGTTLYIEDCLVQYGRSICAYDEEKKLQDTITGALDGSITEAVTYHVPNNVRYIRVTGKVNTAPKITKINYPINADLKYLADSIDKTKESISENNDKFGISNPSIGELTDNSFIFYAAGTVSAAKGSAVTDFISVAPGARVEIKGAYLEGNRSICGYDRGKKYITYFAYNTSNTECVIESVPMSVKYIRVTCRSGIAPTITQESILRMDDVYLPPITIEGEFESGYLGTDGKLILAGDIYRISPYIAVHPHQEIEVRNFMALGGYSLHCYDADKKTVKSFEEPYNSIVSRTFELPFDAHFIRVHTAAGKESALAISYTKQVRHDAGTIELVNEWFDGAHGKIDKLFNMATKKPIITFIDDDTTSVEGVKRFRDICMELGIRGTYACITAVLDGNTGLKDTLLEYQNEGFQIAMHAHYEHDLYAKIHADLAAGNALDENELKTLERDFVTCIQRLKSFGFIATDFWITPGGSHTYVHDELIRKWGINCYVTCGNDRLDYEGTNPKRGRYGLVRPSIGPDDTSGSQTLAEVKTIIDNASIDNGWVLVCTHMAQGGWADESARNRFKELVNYARDKGFEVRTLNDAWRIREPIYRLYEMF